MKACVFSSSNNHMNYETNCNIDSFPSNKFLSVDTTTLTVCVSRPCVLSSHYSPSQFLMVILDNLKKRNISICRNFWQQIVGMSAAFLNHQCESQVIPIHVIVIPFRCNDCQRTKYSTYFTIQPQRASRTPTISHFFKFKEAKLMTFTTSTNYAQVN